MIERNIWQTYKTPFWHLPDYATSGARSLIDLNPGWNYRYVDDAEAESFVEQEFGQEWLKLYRACPLGVMRADIWRYMVIFKRGGVYADIDTTCRRPIESWIRGSCRMFAALEHAEHFCQWTFAAEAGHPLLACVLDVVKHNLRSPDYTDVHFVHSLTGPGAWTSGLLAGLQQTSANLLDDALTIAESASAKQHGLMLTADINLLRDDAVHHAFGSANWSNGTYKQWLADLREFMPGGRPVPHAILFQDSARETFSRIYATNEWGGSGPGSDPVACRPLVDILATYVTERGIASICDLGCGDMQWMPRLIESTGIEYTGVDVVRELVADNRKAFPKFKFIEANIASMSMEQLPDVDLFFIKDTLQHWPSDLCRALA